MINGIFYSEKNLVRVFRPDIKHFLRREYHKVFDYSEYVVQEGEDLYDIAKKWFGENQEYHWTIIADINNIRKPDDITVGEILKLPNTILSETENRLPYYGKYATISTTI